MSCPHSALAKIFALVLGVLLVSQGRAEETAESKSRMGRLRETLLVTPLPSTDEERRLFEEGLGVMQARRFGTWPAPGSTIASPSGYGAQWTEFFAGISVQNRPRYRNKANGTGFIGFGLGNARDWVAFEVSIGLHGLLPPGDRGALNLKVHRLLPGEAGIAFGWDNVAGWGGTDGKSAFYLALSKTFNLRNSDREMFSMVSLHAGVGNGSYRSEEAVFTDVKTLGWFASVGLRVFAPMTLIANWSGQDLFAGASFTPFRTVPISVTVAAQDLTGHAGDGTRYSVSFAYSESIYRLSPF